jgi:hypothetical protein
MKDSRLESWKEAKSRFKTLNELFDYVSSNITYEREPSGVLNHTQSPEETCSIGTGDCEDFAYIFVDWLNSNGHPEAKMLTMGYIVNGIRNFHTAAAFEEDGKWYFIQGCNNPFKPMIGGGYENLEEMAQAIVDERNKALGGKAGLLAEHIYLESPEEFIEINDKLINP